MKYLKVYMGVSSGSYLGRDDGYPEQKTKIIESLDDLVKSYDPSAEYYKMEKVDVSAAVQAVKDFAK